MIRLLACAVALVAVACGADDPPAPPGDALVEAAGRGDAGEVRRLVAAGAPIDHRGAGGVTPLLAAAHGDHVEAARVLVEAGADVNLQDDRLDSPFLYAGAEGLLEIVRLTAPRADTRLRNRYGGVALIPASERGHVEVVRFLLEETDVDVDHVNDLGWTALLEAVVLGDGGPRHVEVVRLLLAHGADPAIADRDGVTPLQHARARGQVAVAALLERAGSGP